MRSTLWVGVASLLWIGCDGGTPGADAATDAMGGDASADASVAARDDVLDRDGDRIVDSLDAFPDDSAEQYDGDGDGIGNAAELDEDGDGVDDELDELPFDAARDRYRQIDEVEPNDAAEEATPAGMIAVRLSGEIAAGEVDRFAIELAVGTLASARLDAGGSADVTLELADATGRTRAHLPVRAGRGAGYDDALGYLADESGTIQIVVRASASAVRTTYEIMVFADGDLDALDDDRELALSADPYSADRDEDGVYDASELIAPLDADGDGHPNWRDEDADGDGVPDRMERDGDPDGDGVPSHLDTDADGDGRLDAAELGGRMQPRDLDGDRLIDIVDLDDDADGLADAIDPEPERAERAHDVLAPDRVIVTSAASRMPDGAIVEGVARGGATLLVRGSGFGTDAAAVRVLAEDDATPTMFAVGAITDSEIELALARTASVRRIWIRVGTRRSNGFALHPSRDGEPLLVRFDPPVVEANGTSTAHGYDLGDVNLVGDSGDEMQIVEQTASSVLFGATASSRGGVHATSVERAGVVASNRLPLVRVTTDSLRVTLPAGTSLTLADLSITGADGSPLTLATGAPNVVPVAEGGELITASYPNASGADSLFLMTLAPAGELDVTGTAVTLLVLSSDLLTRPGHDLPRAFAVASTLPEVRALATHLETALAADPRFLDAPDATYATLLDAAARVFRETVIGDSTSAPVRPPATISEEQHDVLVYETEDGGEIGVENDSMLYLSARVIDAEDETLFYRDHITDTLDPALIGTQTGALLLFNADRVDLGVPSYRNVVVEVLTPGFGPGVAPDDPRSVDARFFLMVRTFVDRAFCPALVLVTGRAAPNDLIVQAIVQQLPDSLQSARNLYEAGNGAAALQALITAIKTDFENIGPLTQAVAFILGASVVTVLDRIARKIASALVPVFGQIANVAQAVSEGATATNVGKYLVDVFTMPPVLRFDVTWELFVDGAVPNYIEARSPDRRIYIGGGDFSPALDAEGREVLPEIMFGSYATRPVSVSSDGRDMVAVLPADVIRAYEGRRIEITVRHRGESATRFDAIRITDAYSLDELDPPHGLPGSLVILRGGVFSGDPRRVSVTFASSPDLADVTTTIHQAHVVSTSNTEIHVLAPRSISSGAGEVGARWWVQAWVGPVGFETPSNARELTVAAPGTWIVRRTAPRGTWSHVDMATVAFTEDGQAIPYVGPVWYWATSWSNVTPEGAHCALSVVALMCCPAGSYDVDIDFTTGRITGEFYTNAAPIRRGTVEGRWYPHE